MRSALFVFAVGVALLGACATQRPVDSVPAPPRLAVMATTRAAAPAAAPPPIVAAKEEEPAPRPEPPKEPDSACNDQTPHDFLIRGNYLPKGDAAEMKRRRELHGEAVKYRTERYGYFAGFGKREWNPKAPGDQLEDVTFFGKPIKMHTKVVPALRCAEAEIKRVCTDKVYQPRGLAGIRWHNTFAGFEITNHAYGIAIDIDPGLNTCCGCVKPWSEDPRCFSRETGEYARMAMPECWVHAFERFGFYWLGHDVLKDTMHFEFLADPEKIVRAPGAQPVSAR
jgi:hypothetical protein